METWTIKSASTKRLEATEMWFLRRLLKIPWIEKVSDTEVLERANVKQESRSIIEKRTTAYLSHIIRGENYEILRLISEGRIEGKRPRGRRKYSWSKNIKIWNNANNINDLIKKKRERRI
ncbi:hypothetical protein PGB90_000465 [Kerria lacca]